MVYESLKLSFNMLTAFYWLFEYPSLRLGDVSFRNCAFFVVFMFFLKTIKRIWPNFFQGLGENTSLQSALKSTALGYKTFKPFSVMKLFSISSI